MYSPLKIIFGGVIIVLANKSITMHNFTLLSVSVMISSLNDYWKLATFKSCRKPISQKLLHAPWNERLYYSSKKSILSPVQLISTTTINRIKYYLDPLEEISWKCSLNSGLSFHCAIWLLTRYPKITVSSWKVYFIQSLWDDLDSTRFYQY